MVLLELLRGRLGLCLRVTVIDRSGSHDAER